MIGILAAGTLLLVASAFGKLHDPSAGRQAIAAARLPFGALLQSRPVVYLTAVAEVAVTLAVWFVGGRAAVLAFTVTFLALAAFSRRMATVAPTVGCGCFGRVRNPVTGWHIGTNLAFTTAGVVTVAHPPGSLVAHLGTQPWFGVPLAVLVAVLAYASYLLMTALPALLAAADVQEAVR